MFNSTKKKLRMIPALLSLVVLAFFISPGISEGLNEDPINNDLFLAVLHPEVVPVENRGRTETVITLINLGNKPISLGKVDLKTGRLVGGDYELRVSVDISNAPLRHIQLGGVVAASYDAPFMSANLISGVTFIPGSGLWITVTALSADSIEVSHGGDAKFTFTLLSSVEGKIKTLVEMRFTMRYEKGKQSQDTRRIQASIEPENPVPAPIITISSRSKDEYMKKVEAVSGKSVLPKGEVPDMAFYAYVTNSEGNVIGFWKNLKKAQGLKYRECSRAT